MSDDLFLHMYYGEHAPTEGLGGDRPYGTPTEVIELGKAGALTGTDVGRDEPARLTGDGAGPEERTMSPRAVPSQVSATFSVDPQRLTLLYPAGVTDFAAGPYYVALLTPEPGHGYTRVVTVPRWQLAEQLSW